MVNFKSKKIYISVNNRRNFILKFSAIFIGLILSPNFVVFKKNRWILSKFDI